MHVRKLFPSNKVKTFFKRDRDEIILVHQFDPFDYIISKDTRMIANTCKYCDMYKSNQLFYRLGKVRGVQSHFFSGSGRDQFIDLLAESDLFVPLLLETDIYDGSNARPIKEEVVKACLSDMNNKVKERVALDWFAMYMSVRSDSKMNDSVCRAMKHRNYRLNEEINTIRLDKIFLPSCEGPSEFGNDPCYAGFNFNTVDTFCSLKTHFLVSRYYFEILEEDVPDEEDEDGYRTECTPAFVPGGYYLFEFDSETNMFIPPNINNIYPEGRICFGAIKVDSCQQAFQTFWTTNFNSDLDGPKDCLTAKEFFNICMSGATELESEYVGLNADPVAKTVNFIKAEDL